MHLCPVLIANGLHLEIEFGHLESSRVRLNIKLFSIHINICKISMHHYKERVIDRCFTTSIRRTQLFCSIIIVIS